MINIEVEKKSNENTTSALRRFTKHVRDSGILNRVRGLRYYSRPPSRFVKKKETLKRLRKQAERQKLIKLGKIAPRTTPFRKR